MAAISFPKFGRRWIGCAGGFKASEVIKFKDVSAVGGIGEFEPQHLRILLGLLHGVGCGFIGSLCLHHGQGKIAAVAQEIINAARWLANEALAYRHNPAVGNSPLLRD